MVVRNKLHRIIDKYVTLLEKNKTVTVKNRYGTYQLSLKRGIDSKKRIINFFLKNNRWPSRLSAKTEERKLGFKFENCISKESPLYDPSLRRIAMTTGRTSNNKRKHNVRGFKKEILEFIQEHGRVPAVHAGGESQLRSRLDYYTNECNDMTLLGQVYEVDKCHKSGIPSKYRVTINEALSGSKPLIRLVK